MDHRPETFVVELDAPPLRVDDSGSVRIGKTRITLDLVVEQYENGMTPDDLVRAYDSLSLADVYSAIGYYLRHRDDVHKYLQARKADAESIRTKIESERAPITKAELMARRDAMEKNHAPVGQ